MQRFYICEFTFTFRAVFSNNIVMPYEKQSQINLLKSSVLGFLDNVFSAENCFAKFVN